jgi:hypothetical protein
MTVTAYPATRDIFSVNRVQQGRLPVPRTRPLTRPLTQPVGIRRASTDLFPGPEPRELAEPGAVMNPADRIAWHVQQAQASRSKAGESGAIGDWAQRLKAARASAC